MKLLRSTKTAGVLVFLNLIALLVILFVRIPEEVIVIGADDYAEEEDSSESYEVIENETASPAVIVDKTEPSAVTPSEPVQKDDSDVTVSIKEFDWFDALTTPEGARLIRHDDEEMQSFDAYSGSWKALMNFKKDGEITLQWLCQVEFVKTADSSCDMVIHVRKTKAALEENWYDDDTEFTYACTYSQYGASASTNDGFIMAGPFWHEGNEQYGIGYLEQDNGDTRDIALYRNTKGDK